MLELGWPRMTTLRILARPRVFTRAGGLRTDTVRLTVYRVNDTPICGDQKSHVSISSSERATGPVLSVTRKLVQKTCVNHANSVLLSQFRSRRSNHRSATDAYRFCPAGAPRGLWAWSLNCFTFSLNRPRKTVGGAKGQQSVNYSQVY